PPGAVRGPARAVGSARRPRPVLSLGPQRPDRARLGADEARRSPEDGQRLHHGRLGTLRQGAMATPSRPPVVPTLPRSLYLETTNRCDSKCQTCVRTIPTLEPPAPLPLEACS